MRLTDAQRELAADPKVVASAGRVTAYWGGRFPGCRDDVESDVMLEVCRAAADFDPGRGVKFITYAVTRAHCAARNRVRIDARRRAHFAGDSRRLARAGRVALPKFEVADWFDHVTAGMPPGQRAAVLAVYRDGLDNAAAGERLGISPAAVSMRLTYARRVFLERGFERAAA